MYSYALRYNLIQFYSFLFLKVLFEAVRKLVHAAVSLVAVASFYILTKRNPKQKNLYRAHFPSFPQCDSRQNAIASGPSRFRRDCLIKGHILGVFCYVRLTRYI